MSRSTVKRLSQTWRVLSGLWLSPKGRDQPSRLPKQFMEAAQALQPEAIAVYGQRATGTKYLINPNKAVST